MKDYEPGEIPVYKWVMGPPELNDSESCQLFWDLSSIINGNVDMYLNGLVLWPNL